MISNIGWEQKNDTRYNFNVKQPCLDNLNSIFYMTSNTVWGTYCNQIIDFLELRVC